MDANGVAAAQNPLHGPEGFEQYRQVFEACPTALVLVDERGWILQVNSESERLFGYDRTELIGGSVGRLIPSQFRQAHTQHVASFFAAPTPRAIGQGRDLMALGKGGGTFPIEIGLNVVRGPGPVQVLASIVDLSERKRVEEKNAEMERFLRMVSHDLKSPLITIKSYAGLIAKNLAANELEKIKPDLEQLGKAAERMNRLLGEVLKLTGAGRSVNPPETVSMTSIAEEARECVAGQIMESGAVVEIAPDLPQVFVDRARLVEVLQNLLDNAVKFAGAAPEPLVCVGAQNDGDETRFFVHDNGIGIEQRDLKRVFGLFTKLSTCTEGTGVGLALAKRIVEAHGGRIWAESGGPGNGSTFWFTLGKPPQTASTE